MIDRFLSCDWGTSSFRLRLVEVTSFKTIAEENSKEGSASTYDRWQKAAEPEENRYGFYRNVIQDHLKKLEQQTNETLDDVPLVISGMASSSIGMMELPYKDFPFSIDGTDLETKLIDTSTYFKHPTILISGVKTDNDVMRGEEVQLVGSAFSHTEEEQLFLHAGTHSKHIIVKNGKAISLKTYMTGELFSLLSAKSILSASVQSGDLVSDMKNVEAFEQGAEKGFNGNLLHEVFMIRTNNLMDKLSKTENWFYLSGLLIGSELKALPESFSGVIVLAGEPLLTDLYSRALQCLGISKKVKSIQIKAANEITIKGQFEVFNKMKVVFNDLHNS